MHGAGGPGGGLGVGDGKRELLNDQTIESTSGRCRSRNDGLIGVECELAKIVPYSMPLTCVLPVQSSARAASVSLELKTRLSQVMSTARAGTSVLSKVPSSLARRCSIAALEVTVDPGRFAANEPPTQSPAMRTAAVSGCACSTSAV